jgi:hypothetical protein
MLMECQSQERQTMSDLIQLGSTSIDVKDGEFGNGFQVGYLHFKKTFEGKPITDELLSTIVAQTFIDVRHTSRCNTGYLVGFLAALLEKQPRHDTQTARILPFAQRSTEV